MAKVNNEQLEKLILEECSSVFKEVKKYQSRFNEVAHKHVIWSLNKKGQLNEAWYDWVPGGQTARLRGALKDAGSSPFVDDPAAYAQMHGELTPQGGREYEESEARRIYGGKGYKEPASDTMQPRGGIGELEANLPPDYKQELIRITQGAPVEFRNNIESVGDTVYGDLNNEIGGLKTKEQIGDLVIEIIRTVVQAMGSAGGRRWAREDAFENIAPEPYSRKMGIGGEPDEPSMLDQLMAQR